MAGQVLEDKGAVSEEDEVCLRQVPLADIDLALVEERVSLGWGVSTELGKHAQTSWWMVSAARAQYLKPMRGFQSNFFAFSPSSCGVMGFPPMPRSVAFILALTGGDARLTRELIWRLPEAETVVGMEVEMESTRMAGLGREGVWPRSGGLGVQKYPKLLEAGVLMHERRQKMAAWLLRRDCASESDEQRTVEGWRGCRESCLSVVHNRMSNLQPSSQQQLADPTIALHRQPHTRAT